MNLRLSLLNGTDRALGLTLALTLAGSCLAFGGRVWWAPGVLAVLAFLLVLGCAVRGLLAGRAPWLGSPLTFLALLTLGLGVAQLAPLPAGVAARLSPPSRSVYGLGFLTERARVLDPSLPLPNPPAVRSPVSLDRGATLRWLAGASVCLAVFWAVAQYADRLKHYQWVCGSLLAAFFLNTGLAVVQLVSGSRGLFGFIEPGRGPVWAPSALDALTGPGETALRVAGLPKAGHPALAVTVPEPAYLVGSLMGGPGAYLALAALALPLALGLTLQLLAPRGSREPLGVRLGQSGQGSLVVLLYGSLVLSALVVGLLAGPWYALPFALALVAAGLPGARASGLGWGAAGLTALAVAALGSGVALGALWSRSVTFPAPVAPLSVTESARVWSDARPILKDFPWLGTGLGTFAAVYPDYKTQDLTSATARSSLLQWWVESGYAGLGLLALGALWCLWRLPGAVRRVGTADRSLAFGLIGAGLGFSVFSVIHWTIELTSVALAASALAGAGNRWLAGGTDLFVERG